jgi:hypothetical protein
LLGPDGVEVLVGSPTQQQSAHIGYAFPGLRHRGIGRCPAAVLEAAPAVLVWARRRLHDSIKSYTRKDNDFAHVFLLTERLSVNLSEPACYKMQAQPGEMTFRSSVKLFSCRCSSGLKTKQANSLNLGMSQPKRPLANRKVDHLIPQPPCILKTASS